LRGRNSYLLLIILLRGVLASFRGTESAFSL
jgi:hypothetical protein